VQIHVLTVLLAATLVGATSALGHESGTRPVPGIFKGTFQGKGSGDITFEVFPEGRTSPRVGVRWLGGFVPGVCVKDGRTRVAGRDGAIGVGFDLRDELRRRPNTVIPEDGAIAFTLVHPADVLNGASYSVSIRGTFGRKIVSGRVRATGVDPLTGKCRGDRLFTARLSRG
jgi:hypothetical protein